MQLLRRWETIRLGVRIAIMLTLLALFSTLTVGYVIFINGKTILERQIQDHLVSVVALKSYQVDEWYNEEEEDIELLAQSPNLVVSYATLLAQPQDKLHQSQSYQRISDFLRLQLVKEEDFFEFFIMDTEGKIVISSDKEQEDKYKANRPYFVNGKKSTFVQNVYHSLTLGEPALTMSAPVEDENGAVLGVLAGRVQLDELSQFMRDYPGLGETGDTYLVNRYNFFITEPRLGEGYALRKAIHTEGVEQCLAGKSGTSQYEDYHGAPVLGAYQWLPEREIGVITEMHQSEAFAMVDQLRDVVRLVIVLIAAAFAGIGLLVGRTVGKPVEKLIKGVNEVASGNLDYRVAIESKSEVGQMADAFNNMAASLKEKTERLQIAAIEAQSANQAKSEFLSSVSHELRTPLTAVIGLAQLLQKKYYGALNEKQTEYVQDILESSNHLLSLINDILDLTKLEAGQSRLELVETQVKELMEGSMLLVKESAAKNKVSVQLKIPKQILKQKITLDKRSFKQIMVNLLSNAVKFTPAGGKVTIEAEKRQDDLMVSVADTGIGISSGDTERIFDAFYQVRARTTGKSPGTGLGLSLTKHLVEQHHGQIWVESEGIGKGSRFSFIIPMNLTSQERDYE